MFMCLYTYMGVSELAKMCLGRKVGRIEREKFVRAWSMEFGQTGPKYLQAGQLSDAEITCIPAARQVCTVQNSHQPPALSSATTWPQLALARLGVRTTTSTISTVTTIGDLPNLMP